MFLIAVSYEILAAWLRFLSGVSICPYKWSKDPNKTSEPNQQNNCSTKDTFETPKKYQQRKTQNSWHNKKIWRLTNCLSDIFHRYRNTKCNPGPTKKLLSEKALMLAKINLIELSSYVETSPPFPEHNCLGTGVLYPERKNIPPPPPPPPMQKHIAIPMNSGVYDIPPPRAEAK